MWSGPKLLARRRIGVGMLVTESEPEEGDERVLVFSSLNRSAMVVESRVSQRVERSMILAEADEELYLGLIEARGKRGKCPVIRDDGERRKLEWRMMYEVERKEERRGREREGGVRVL